MKECLFEHQFNKQLRFACRSGNVEAIQEFVCNGADVNHTADHNNRTVLHAAAERGHPDVISMLVKLGAEINVTDINGWTPIHYAAFRVDTEAIRALAALGADVNSRTTNDWAPLCVAADSGNTDAVRTLVTFGASLNARTNCGMTPIFRALLRNHTGCMAMLADLGADIDVAADNGLFLIHYAALYSRLETIKALTQIMRQANASLYIAETESNKTAFDLTKRAEVKQFLQAEMNFERRRHFLMFLAGCQYLHRNLLQKSVDETRRTKTGCTFVNEAVNSNKGQDNEKQFVSLNASANTPLAVVAVLGMRDMQREIMSFL